MYAQEEDGGDAEAAETTEPAPEEEPSGDAEETPQEEDDSSSDEVEGEEDSDSSPEEEDDGEEEAEASPTPTPTPTPISFLPPLSLRECLNLIDRVLEELPEADEEGGEEESEPLDVPLDSLLRMVKSASNYLSFRDDLHTSLAHYTWVRMDDAKVQNDPDSWDKDTLEFEPPVRRISALSFEVRRGDAWIHGVRVIDENDELRYEYYPKPPKLLQHSLPRREVFHLWTRTTISEIEVEYSRANPKGEVEPKVVVFGGKTDRREYIKTAIYRLRLAGQDIEQRNWGRSRRYLENAKENINDYIRRNQR